MHKIITIMIAMLSGIALSGCANQSPTQQYRTGVDLHNLAMQSAIVAIDNDWISEDEEQSIEKLRILSRAKLGEARARLAINPNDQTVRPILDQALDLIRAIRSLAAAQPTISTETEPLPVPQF